MPIQSINPFTDELLKEYEEHTEEQLERIIQNAQQAYLGWKKTSFTHREELMNSLAELLKNNKKDLAIMMTREMGKPITEAISEIEKCALVCEYYAENAEKFLADQTLPVEQGEAWRVFDPLGTVLAVMPWNFPFWQVFRFAAPNIMAGNAGLLKHASNVPQSAMAIQDLFLEAGFPSGIFQTLMISSGKVNQVIDHPLVKAATLTGSETAGSKVAERAGRNLKKTVLELGGSDPYIILADADLQQAAKTAVKGRMINTGQSCIAAKRFIVEESIAADFLEIYIENVQKLQAGDPMDENVDYGPLARKDLVGELTEQVQKSLEKGATLLHGTGKGDDEERFFHPCIIGNVKPGMPAYDQELFGPVAIFFSVQDAEAAVALANDSPFGLGGSLWSNDTGKAKNLARNIETGTVIINGMMASHPKTPFGGIKKSGYGRELAEDGIKEFMNIKTIWIK
ncbi:MAG: NAD-dependent succinate-semialdehyde dehydrogenase [Cyclobacteriaceae bacterium]